MGHDLGLTRHKHPKVHLIDSGVMAWLLNLTPQKIAQAAPAPLTEYQVIAVEVKAGSRISGEDFRGLRQLKERLGRRLEEAIILHTGGHAYVHDDWITVLPLDRLWASTEGQTQP